MKNNFRKLFSRIYIGILMACLTFISCESRINSQYQNDSQYTLVSKGFKSIQIDTLTTNKPYSVQYYNQKGKDILSFINSHHNEIQLYDLNKGLLIEKLVFDKNLFGQITGYYIQSPDSIFIVSAEKMKAYLFNQNLEEIQSYKIDNSQGSPITVSNLNLFYLNQKLYIVNQLAIIDKKRVDDESLISVFDLGGSQESFSFLSFPDNYEEPFSPELGLYYPAVDFEKKEIYLSFSASNLIQNYTTDDHFNFSEFELKPAGKFTIENSKGKSLSQSVDRQLYYFENHNFGNILVDPFQNLFIRMAYYPLDDAKSMMKNKSEIFKKRKAVIADLKTQQVLLETFLDEESYYEGLMVATPLGMLINKYSDDEDEILFEIFKVEKN